ncbi:MAG TPA: cellulase family glycosylhydrolase [Polyangiaceae bacterium]|nr:cellulase family glycosylhydrolase [Polyangiaceae bacterium]
MRRPNHKVLFNGQPQIWLGVNFWSRTGGPLMWRYYDPKVVREELDIMKEHGMTLTRSFFYWPDFMPTPDRLDEELCERFRDFLDAHEERGMTSIPTFLVGHMSGQNWDPAWRGDRDLFEDVWFVARQAFYVRELTARFADHPAVVAWLLTNEVPIYGDWKSRGNGVLKAQSVLSWAQILIDAVRAGGGYHPVSIGEGAWGVEVNGTDNGFRVRDIAGLVDFLGPHVYRMETDQLRQHLGAAFVCELLDFQNQPVVMEEFGVTSDYTSDENAAHYYRHTLHHTLLAGATGWITWNNTDYDDIYMQAPYSHHPFELHFGLVDKHGKAKPAAREVKKFGELLERIDLASCSRPDTRIALVVPSYLENQYPFTAPDDALGIVENLRQAYVAAREADLPVKLVREADGLLWQPAHVREIWRGVAAGGVQYGRTVTDPVALAPGELDPRALGPGLPKDGLLYLIPSVKQLTAPTWRELRQLAADGATVYLSYFVGAHKNQRGPWWPDLDETFGVRKQLRYGLVNRIEDERVTFEFERPFGSIAAGERMEFAVAGNENSRAFLPVEAAGAHVIARDARGRPALLEHRTGQGRLVLCTYPIEHMAALTMGVNPEPTWRLYAALAEVAGVAPEVSVNDPRIIVGEMVHDDGRRFVWFISESETPVSCTPRIATGALRELEGGALKMPLALEPFEVRVVERVG